MINWTQYTPRPGEKAHVSPEGIIFSTDGKCRWVYETAPTLVPFPGRPRCLLFTMDESSVSLCQVKGRVHKDEVVHAFAVWVGGQSQPALRFEPPRQISLYAVRRITSNPAKNLIRIRTVRGGFSIHAEPAQFDFILGNLARHCPQAKLAEK